MIHFCPYSYRYFQESGLYYLQSRYYDPEIGRFINADDYPSTGQGLLGNNMFAYCNNNPIIRVDTSGEFFNTICGAIIGGAIAALTCGEGETPAQAFLRGAVTGAIAGAGLDLCIATAGIGGGLIVAGVTGAASGMIDTIWEKKNQGKDINWGEAVANGIIGAGLNVLFGAAGRELSNPVGKTLKEVGKAVVTNFTRSITNDAGKIVTQKAIQATVINLSYSAVQGAAAKVYSLITAKMLEET